MLGVAAHDATEKRDGVSKQHAARVWGGTDHAAKRKKIKDGAPWRLKLRGRGGDTWSARQGWGAGGIAPHAPEKRVKRHHGDMANRTGGAGSCQGQGTRRSLFYVCSNVKSSHQIIQK